MKSLWTTVLFVILLVACNKDDVNTPEQQAITPPVTPVDVEASLVVKDRFDQVVDTFLQGEVIRFELSVKNLSTTNTAVLNFVDAPQYDVWVMAKKAEVWRLPGDEALSTALTSVIILAPEEVKTFIVVWDQMMNDGKALPIGNYTAKGKILIYAPEVETSLTIQ